MEVRENLEKTVVFYPRWRQLCGFGAALAGEKSYSDVCSRGYLLSAFGKTFQSKTPVATAGSWFGGSRGGDDGGTIDGSDSQQKPPCLGLSEHALAVLRADLSAVFAFMGAAQFGRYETIWAAGSESGSKVNVLKPGEDRETGKFIAIFQMIHEMPYLWQYCI